jgi:hypothetical protein
MTIEEMHYDFKRKVNKNDSHQNRNFLIPEIDLALNEAQELFVKWIAEPRVKNHLGVETTQRTIDDLRTIIVHESPLSLATYVDSGGVVQNYVDIYQIPVDYWYYLNGICHAKKGICRDIKCNLVVQKHNDLFEDDVFRKSSFEWREVNILFIKEGIKCFTDNTFEVEDMSISYIKRPVYIHYASGFNVLGYNTASGLLLMGKVDCELPEQVHSEIVDIAALLVTGNIASPEFELKLAKLKLNEIKS